MKGIFQILVHCQARVAIQKSLSEQFLKGQKNRLLSNYESGSCKESTNNSHEDPLH